MKQKMESEDNIQKTDNTKIRQKMKNRGQKIKDIVQRKKKLEI